MAVNFKPEGYHSVTPYLYIKGAAKAIDFYKTVFGAEEKFRMPNPDGTIGHAEIGIGDSIIMLADEQPSMGALSPETVGGSPSSIMLYIADVDAVVERAVAGGAVVTRPAEDKFYGDRVAGIKDPFSFPWFIGTHIKDMTMDEMIKAGAEAEG